MTRVIQNSAGGDSETPEPDFQKGTGPAYDYFSITRVVQNRVGQLPFVLQNRPRDSNPGFISAGSRPSNRSSSTTHPSNIPAIQTYDMENAAISQDRASRNTTVLLM